MYVEHRMHHHGLHRIDMSLAATDSPIEFHPELTVRWDDETSGICVTTCARRGVSDRRVRARSGSVAVRPRSFAR